MADAADAVSRTGGQAPLQSPRSFQLAATGPYFASLLLLAMVTFSRNRVSLPLTRAPV